MPKHLPGPATELRRFGFHARRALVHEAAYAATIHTEVELVCVLRGRIRYSIAGRDKEAIAGRMLVFWGGTPHRGVWVRSPTEYIGVHVPLDWVLAWSLSNGLAARLLGGEWFEDVDRTRRRAADDRSLFVRWAHDLGVGDPEMRDIVALEIEARLRRLAASLGPTTAHNSMSRRAPKEHAVERVAQFIAAHYREPLTLADVAQAAGLHPTYLPSVFKRWCGMSVWEYVLRTRVGHAQRLLVDSELNVLEVAIDSGFGSTTQFYEAFKRTNGMTPGRYRALRRLEG